MQHWEGNHVAALVDALNSTSALNLTQLNYGQELRLRSAEGWANGYRQTAVVRLTVTVGATQQGMRGEYQRRSQAGRCQLVTATMKLTILLSHARYRSFDNKNGYEMATS